jgi:hypothetical protein
MKARLLKFVAPLLAVSSVLLFGVLAFAQTPVEPVLPDPSNLVSVATYILDAIRGHTYGYVIAAVLSLFVFYVKKYDHTIPKYGDVISGFFDSDAGGVLLAFLGAFAVALAASQAAAGAVFTWAMCKTAAILAGNTIGVYVIAKKLLFPFISWAWTKIFSGSAKADAIATSANAAGSNAAAGTPTDAANIINNMPK